MSEGKDFSKYAYFRSKAKNYAFCVKPEKKSIVDGQVQVVDKGMRIEFRNGMLRVERGPLGDVQIKALREEIEKEKKMDPRMRMIFEETASDETVPKALYDAQEARIKELEAERDANKEDSKEVKEDKGKSVFDKMKEDSKK